MKYIFVIKSNMYIFRWNEVEEILGIIYLFFDFFSLFLFVDDFDKIMIIW